MLGHPPDVLLQLRFTCEAQCDIDRDQAHIPIHASPASSGSTGRVVNKTECRTLDAAVPLPIEGEVGGGFFDVNGLGLSIPCQLNAELIRLYPCVGRATFVDLDRGHVPPAI
jgi:hypothetical protein